MVRCHPLLPDSYTKTAEADTASLIWTIKSDEPLTPKTVADAPETPAVGDLYPYDRRLVCQSVDFKANGSSCDWTCTAQYATRTLGAYSRTKKPWENPPDIRNSVEYITEVADTEFVTPYDSETISPDGEAVTAEVETRALTNRFGWLFDPAPQTRTAIDVKTLTWYVRAWRDEWTEDLRDTVNLRQVAFDGRTYAAAQVWLSDLVANRHYYEEDKSCWQVAATFRIKRKGWKFRPMLAGFSAREDDIGSFHAIYEQNGVFYLEGVEDVRGMQPIQTPVPLNEDGTLMFRTRASIRSGYKSIVYEAHQLIKPADWTTAAIPAMKAIEV